MASIRHPAPSLSPSPIRFPYRDPDGFLGVIGDVLVLVARHESTLEGCDAVRAELERVKRDGSPPVALVVIIESSAGMPDASVRKAFGAILSELGSAIGAYAAIHESTGFHGAAARAIVTSVLLASRPSFPHSVFGSLEPAAAWLIEKRAFSPDRPELLVGLIENVRRTARSLPLP